MTAPYRITTKDKPRWFQFRWKLSYLIMRLARWVYPPSPEVWAFITQMAMDEMIFGGAIRRIKPEDAVFLREHNLPARPDTQPASKEEV